MAINRSECVVYNSHNFTDVCRGVISVDTRTMHYYIRSATIISGVLVDWYTGSKKYMVWMLTSFQTFVFGSTLAKHLFTSTNNTVLQGNIKHHSVYFTDSNIMLHTCILVTKNNDIHCYSCNLLSTRMLQCGVYRYSYQNILVY